MTYFNKQNNRGSASVFVLIFGVVASIFLGGLVMMASMQYDYSLRTNAYEQALTIAEAGISYYQWHLAHSPQDFTDGTGNVGPYEHEYKDPQGEVIGGYSLRITPPTPGSSVITITSTGYSREYPEVKRTVSAKLGVMSMARYAFLHNSSVFFGSGVYVHGTVMSNAGIRQDGINDAIMQSALDTYVCGLETGCKPSEVKPAIWGEGGSKDLWQFPVPAVDFSSVTVSFATMKADAQSFGVYKGPSNSYGYHVVFEEDGTADVYIVTKAKLDRGLDAYGNCVNMYQEIQTESFVGTYSLADKHIFFFEDTVWVEGVVNGSVTVAAARFPFATNSEDIWVNNTLSYIQKNGQHRLGLISQRNIYFVRNLPDEFELDAALMAQNGSVFRHGFHVPGCTNNGNAIRTKFTLYGSIVSGQPSAWNWGTPPGSGFLERVITHDNHLTYNPPPYFPVERSGEYELIYWSEEANP